MKRFKRIQINDGKDKRKWTRRKSQELTNYIIKSKEGTLTEEERKEQQILRREYIDSVRMNLRGQLNNISIKEHDGSVTDLGKRHAEKYGNKKGN